MKLDKNAPKCGVLVWKCSKRERGDRQLLEESHSVPRVSIILPTYNRAKLVCRAIDSVWEQSFSDFELIVVDDGSTDDSREILESLYGGRARFRYCYQQHHNVSSARNLGIAMARGELLAFIDSDDAWLPTKLAQQVSAMDDADLLMVHTGRLLMEELGCRRASLPFYCDPLARDRSDLLGGIGKVAMSVLVRKSAVESVGKFDEELQTTQDLDLWLRIARIGKIALIEQPLMKSYKQVDGIMSRDLGQKVRDRLEVFKRVLAEPHPLIVEHNWRAAIARHEDFLANHLNEQQSTVHLHQDKS